MAILTNSNRDDADHATDRLPEPRRELDRQGSGLGWTADDVAEARAELAAHVAAGGCVSEWLQRRTAKGRAA